MEDKLRHINFNKFVQQRSTEIAKFLTDLELDTKKKGHQALPRSVRRRAMSHNRYRIPRRMRKNMEEELAKSQRMQKLPKCRKHIRKRRMLIMSYKMRSSKVQWLSTHLWAAKRMRMTQYYGFKIAQTPNNKSFRAAYRHSQHGCIMADLSYYYSITLTLVSQQYKIPEYLKIKGCSKPQNNLLYEGSIVNNAIICPCFIIQHTNKNNLQINIFFHPAALQQVKKLKKIQNWTASLSQVQTDLYCLAGPHSLQKLQQALQIYGILDDKQSLVQKMYAKLSPVVYFSKSNQHSLINKPFISDPISEEKLLSKGYNSSSNSCLRLQMMNIFSSIKKENNSNKQISLCEQQFWKMFQIGQNHELQKTVFKITLRSRYTHHRKTKMSKEQKKKIIKEDKQSSSECGGRKKKKREESQKEESSFQQKSIYVQNPPKQNTVPEAIHPIMIAKGTHHTFIWASNADSCRFWRILSKLNIKVIGRKQLKHFSLQKGLRQFPEDYPQTLSFKQYLTQEMNKNFKKYIKIPLPKRPNYLQLNSPYPFGPFIPKQPFSVQLQMVSRGNCSKFSYICQLMSEDIPKISQKLSSGHIGIVHSEDGEGERKKYKNIEEIQIDLKTIKSSRKIVGFITSGGYLYSKSRQGGIGFIDHILLSQNYFNRFEQYFLVRKRTSPHYYLAQVGSKNIHQK